MTRINQQVERRAQGNDETQEIKTNCHSGANDMHTIQMKDYIIEMSTQSRTQATGKFTNL